MKHSLFLGIILFSLLNSCAINRPKGPFNPSRVSSAPDYSNPDYWAALPSKVDSADQIPEGLASVSEELAADVFFLYPTIYFGEREDREWNAPVNNADFNKRVDKSTILYQASVFNAAGKVYAPRYRQAHLRAYYSKDTLQAKKVFDLAYQDLKKAFAYYLEHYNKGRPIIIASHSQGTTHGRRLLKEFFDGTPLQNQLVAAYLIGIPVLKDEFVNIPVCQNAHETGCFVSWRTYKKGYSPRKWVSEDIAVVNPLSWTTGTEMVDKSLNRGGLLWDFDKLMPSLTSAQINAQKGILWAKKPKFFGNFLFLRRDYHIADLNFYYLNVRENAVRRVEEYLGK